MEQQGEVRCDLGVELRDVFVWMCVVVGTVICLPISPNEVVLGMRMNDVYLYSQSILKPGDVIGDGRSRTLCKSVSTKRVSMNNHAVNAELTRIRDNGV